MNEARVKVDIGGSNSVSIRSHTHYNGPYKACRVMTALSLISFSVHNTGTPHRDVCS